MPDIRLFTDEQISNAVILGLRQRGVEVLSTPDAGRDGLADDSHLVFACENGYVLLTQDRDFPTLAATMPDHSGIIYAPRSMSIGDTIRGVLLVTGVLTDDEMKGCVEYVQRMPLVDERRSDAGVLSSGRPPGGAGVLKEACRQSNRSARSTATPGRAVIGTACASVTTDASA